MHLIEIGKHFIATTTDRKNRNISLSFSRAWILNYTLIVHIKLFLPRNPIRNSVLFFSHFFTLAGVVSPMVQYFANKLEWNFLCDRLTHEIGHIVPLWKWKWEHTVAAHIHTCHENWWNSKFLLCGTISVTIESTKKNLYNRSCAI